MVTARDVVLAPPYRGGAIAEFPAPRERRIGGRVVAAEGSPALEGQTALDAIVRIDHTAGAIETWLGVDGAFYVEGLAPGEYVLDVRTGDFRCTARLQIPDVDAPVVKVGDLPCVPAPGGPR
jgi:hypothetical protein